MMHRVLLILFHFGMAYAELSYVEVKAEKHGTAYLSCSTRGHDFRWSNSFSGIMKDKTSKYTIFPNGTLKIENVTLLDVGEYKCHIAGAIRSTIVFKLVIDTETILCKVKGDVKLICMAEVPKGQGITTAYNFYAFKDNQLVLISENGKLTNQSKVFGQGKLKTTKSTLQINGIEKQNQGKFLCTVKWASEKRKGHSEYFFNVKVVGESKEHPTLRGNDGPKAEQGKNPLSSGNMERDGSYLTVPMPIIVVALNFAIK